MLKNRLNIFLLSIFAISSVFTSCQKPDATAPVITLNGSPNQTVSLQAPYSDPGATANDNKDGAINVTVYGTVNANLVGTYTITYRAVDANGNIASLTRTVNVKNDLGAMTGNYYCVIAGTPNITYNQTITASTTINKRIRFSKFGNYIGNSMMSVSVAGSTITLANVLAIQVGNPPKDRTFQGSGSIVSATVFNLIYTETTDGITTNRNESFTKQ